MLGPRNRWLTALRILVFAASAALFVGVISAADFHRVAMLVSAVGGLGLAVLLLPQAAALSLESFGWKLAVRGLGRDVRFLPLLRVRVATEALTQSLPAGIVFGESVKPLLLARHCGLRVNESVAAIVARKYLLLLSQAGYVLVIATLGFGVLRAASIRLLGSPGLEWLAYGAGAILAALAVGMAAWLRQSVVAGAVFGLLGRFPSVRLARWLSTTERRFTETDRSVADFFRAGFGRHVLPTLCFAGGWLIESSETFLILRVLGADVSFIEVASLEILLTFVRHVAFVVPAGLGVQDFGYVTGFAALGLPEVATLGAAFVLLKRTKELCWIALGYALLALESKAPGRAPVPVGASSA